MILYHGTDRNIEKFSTNFIGTGTGLYQYGAGIYFTDDINLAKRYGKNIYRVNVIKSRVRKNTSHPPRIEWIIAKIKKAPDYTETLTNWDENPRIAIRDASQSISNSENFGDAIQSLWAEFYNGNDSEFCKEMRSSAIDGITYVDSGKTIVTLFNEDAIKSAELIGGLK